jgi:hypothetical protein
MKPLRLFCLALVISLLVPALTPRSGASGSSPAAQDELSVLRNRVHELEAQVSSCGQQVADLRAENDLLGQVISQISTDQPAPPPKGSKPFEFNGRRSWIMPAAPDGQTPGSKQ